MEFCDPYGWHELNPDGVLAIRSKLAEFEKLTWKEILRPGCGNHRIAVVRICRTAQDRLMELRLDEIDHLVSLRFQGSVRVWGYIDRGVMTLLWWDPDHSVYPMNLANN